MTSILKFQFTPNNKGEVEFNINKYSKILEVDFDEYQQNVILYVLVNSDVKESKKCKLITYSINENMNNNMKVEYVGSYLRKSTGLKYFVFEKII